MARKSLDERAALRILRNPQALKEDRSRLTRKNSRGVLVPKNEQELQKDAVKRALDQRYMRVSDKIAGAQISLALGIQYMMKIDKVYNVKSKTWIAQKPVRVINDFEIALGLEAMRTARDSSEYSEAETEYYYMTADKPDNAAIDSILNRVHGKPTESLQLDAHATFSLVDLAAKRAMLDGNADVVPIVPPAIEGA